MRTARYWRAGAFSSDRKRAAPSGPGDVTNSHPGSPPRSWRSSVAQRPLLCALLRIGVALGLRFLLALLMNWPVKTAVLLGFIVSLSSTAVAITGESEMQRDALLLSFRSAVQKSRPLRDGLSQLGRRSK